jgi:hypothetical protein
MGAALLTKISNELYACCFVSPPVLYAHHRIRPKNSSFFATRNSQLGKELNFATLLRVRVLFFPVNSSFSTRNSEKNA